ncbi:MAG TPA: alpha/beta fold hydrolase [Phototrophicaceae bacterium]|nr:alpha/beta fold hydrolase [Phototrophicaceae bacterium]
MSKTTITRRNLLKGMGATAGLAGISSLGFPRFLAASEATTAQAASPWYETQFIADPLMNERVIWFLDHTWEHMAAVSEVLDIVSRIEPGNNESWMREWFQTADQLRAVGDASAQKGHPLSAGESYLRACGYYLAGLIYGTSGDDPEIRRTAQASADCFQQALNLLNIPGEAVEIPYEDSALPAYFFRSPLATGPAPVLIAHQGMDASVEENLFLAQECVKRGYHCLLLHHPGQGLALRLKGLTYRPDWENVITPVVDYVIAQLEVDPERIALMGISFGGALVTRAVAFEKRIKICIANPAVYSWWDFISAFLFGSNPELGQLLDSDPDAFNTAMQGFLDQAPPMYSWWMEAAMWKWGSSSPADLLTKLKAYTNADIADKVTCTMLVMDGEGETWAAGQAQKLYDALTCPKEYMLFTAEDTGLLHCQTGAMAVGSQRLFDWLEENL